jgi:hypothetical protein
MTGRSASLLFCAVLFAAASASAQEPPPTAVAPFEGRLAPTMRRAVEQAIEEQAAIVDADTVSEAAESAGVSGLESNGVPQLASATGAQLVVQGEVSGSRRSQSIELVVRAADGTELARGRATYRRGRAHRARFDRGVRRVFEEGLAALASHRPQAEEVVERPPREEEAEPPPPSVRPDDGLALATILASVTLRGRSTRIELGTGMPPRLYESGAYAELGLALEVRPLASQADLSRGLFLQGSFGHSVGLGSRVDSPTCNADPSAPGCSVTTNFVRFQLGAGWLAPIGDAVELGVGLSGGLDGYYLSMNTVLPTAEYAFVRPGARGRIRILEEALVVDAEVAYRGVVGIGDLAGSFGESYGAHGVDVGVGVGGNLHTVNALGFAWGVRFDWVGYFLSFAGPASDRMATSGNESSWRVSLFAGWSFL